MANRYSRIAAVAAIVSLVCVLGMAQTSGFAQRAQASYDKHDYATGASLFLLAAQAGPDVSDDLYHAACCFALGGQSDLAFETLAIAIKKGWRDRPHFEADTDLAILHDDPRWKDLLAAFPAPRPDLANKDALINNLSDIAAYSYQYRIRPSQMGGGNGTYLGWKLPDRLAKTANGSFELISVGKDFLRVRATSAGGFGTIEISIDRDGKQFDWTYSGAFAAKVEPAKPAAPFQDARDAMINDLNNLAAWSYQYRIRPTAMGGGNGSYLGLNLPVKMATNENGTYNATAEKDRVVFLGISAKGYGTISVTLDADGRLSLWTYTGQLQ